MTRERLILEVDRWHAAFDDGRIVGGAAAASYRFTVPGGAQVSGAGVTAVGVQPTHRRRGINAALMRAQLDDVHERGEPIAVLYASEGGIYGRFGYGLSAFLGEIDFEGGRSTFIRGYRPVGSVRLLPRAEALPAMRAIYDRAQPRRPGMIAMDDAWWEWLFFEKESEKDEPTFYAVHETDGEPDAYATYRVKHEWPDSIPKLELTVRQLVATTPGCVRGHLAVPVRRGPGPSGEGLEPSRRRAVVVPDGRAAPPAPPDRRRVARAARRRARRAGGARLRRRRSRRRRRRGSVLFLERGPVRASRCPPGRPAAPARTTSPISPAARPIWAPRIWEGRRSGSSIGPAASTSSAPGRSSASTRCSPRIPRRGARSSSSP